MRILLSLLLAAVSVPRAFAGELPVITVGSKAFTESYVLSEIIAQTIERVGEARVNRRFGLGGTGIAYAALMSGGIDIYPEYTGTISETILKDPSVTDPKAIRADLSKMGIRMSEPLGFNNTYAIAARADFAKRYRMARISDLARMPNARIGFSHEFMKRPDGYVGLAERYGLKLSNVKPIAHSLAYEALSRDELDLTDVYSTDAKIKKLKLVPLEDDRHYFPTYLAVFLARPDLATRFPKTWRALKKLEGQFNEKKMIGLNAEADIEKLGFPEIASRFLGTKQASKDLGARARELWRLTRQHVYLVALSVLLSILIGVPLGILSARNVVIGRGILTFSGLLQTIPSLALLCFLIPFFGIGTRPALVALFLYGLLPIVTGVHTGFTGLDPRLIESAKALGLTPFQRLRLIDLPLASRNVMAGIRTSTIIGIGTATLAAMIGAGGYGAPIVTGLALNDVPTILTGAIPAAVMALLASLLFEGLDKLIVPKGIQR